MGTLTPARLIPPGRLIRRELEERGWTQKELAEIVDRPVQAIAEILQGHKQITPETAQELAAALGTSAEVWMNLETAYRLALAARDNEKRAAAIARMATIHNLVPIPELLRRGWISRPRDLQDLEQQVRGFLGVESLHFVAMPAVNFRQAQAREASPGALLAWLRRVETIARQQKVPPFSYSALEAGVPRLLDMAAHSTYIPRVPQTLQDLGVHFVIVPHLQRTYVDGAVLWRDDRPVIALTLRHDRVDNFWMTLMHGIAHVVACHQGIHIDTFDDDAPTAMHESPDEHHADQMARDWLLDAGALATFVAEARPLFSADAVKRFAAAQARTPDIVLGRLHTDGLLEFDRHRFLIGRVRPLLQPWIDTADPESLGSTKRRDDMCTPEPAIPTLATETWDRIVQHKGRPFNTKTGKQFTYSIVGTSVKPNHTERLIGKSDFARAWQMMPIPGPAPLRDIVQGPAYVWAILNDPRIVSVNAPA